MINKYANGIRGGRFRKPLAAAALAFSSSLTEDERLIPYDLACSEAHVRMLARQGIISADDRRRLQAGLRQIKNEYQRGSFHLRSKYEDVHMNIEARLQKLLGPTAAALHTGRSRNDLIAADLRLYLRTAVIDLMARVTELQTALLAAEPGQKIIIPAFTHLRPAQPVSYIFYRLGWFWKFRRDFEALEQLLPVINVSPLGAGALAGTTHGIDPEYIARRLRFDQVFTNSQDAVSDRDFMLETAFRITQIMIHISQFAEDLIIYSLPEVGFFELDEAYTTGSSIMPQKKNPDICELLRGRTASAAGVLSGLTALLKGLPGGYNRDLQEMKAPLFRLIDDVNASLTVATGMAVTTRVTDKWRGWSKTPSYAGCTELVDHLVRRGWRFRAAYHQVAACVRDSREQIDEFINLSRQRLKIPAEDIKKILRPDNSVRTKLSPGGTGHRSVCLQLNRGRVLIAAQKKLISKLRRKYRLA